MCSFTGVDLRGNYNHVNFPESRHASLATTIVTFKLCCSATCRNTDTDLQILAAFCAGECRFKDCPKIATILYLSLLLFIPSVGWQFSFKLSVRVLIFAHPSAMNPQILVFKKKSKKNIPTKFQYIFQICCCSTLDRRALSPTFFTKRLSHANVQYTHLLSIKTILHPRVP